MQQIADWLERLGMSEYAECFVENGIDLSVLPAGGSSYPDGSAGTVGRCNGLRTRSLKPRPVAVSNRPTVTPLSRAQLLHQVQTEQLIEHLMRGIMHYDVEFRREESTSAAGSHARH
jgi:hypothetical protein